MLAVFSRISAGIFIASRAPVSPECSVEFNPCFMLYVPVSGVTDPARPIVDGQNRSAYEGGA